MINCNYKWIESTMLFFNTEEPVTHGAVLRDAVPVMEKWLLFKMQLLYFTVSVFSSLRISV